MGKGKLDCTGFAGHVEKTYNEVKERVRNYDREQISQKSSMTSICEKIVRLVEELGKSPKQVAEDIGVTPQTVRTWVKSSESPAQMRFRVRASSIPLMRSCDR
jgi:predicted transcriptional regulator